MQSNEIGSDTKDSIETHPDGASVYACTITIYYSSGVSKIPRQTHE